MQEFEQIYNDMLPYPLISPILLMRKYKMDFDNAKRICEMIMCIRENSVEYIQTLMVMK